METLAYLHLVEDFQKSENKALNFNLSKTAGQAAIGLTGMACTVSVLGATNAAFACSYHSEHNPDYYGYQSDYSSDYYAEQGDYYGYQSDYSSDYYADQGDYYGYQSDYNQSDYSSSCGCNGSEQSYNPDYSQDYSYGGSYYSYYDAGANIVSPGASGPLIATLQAALSDQGYYAGPIDGVYGPGTADAVAQYQIDRGLAVDGVAGTQTLGSLGLAG